jgi:hypothetical protein
MHQDADLLFRVVQRLLLLRPLVLRRPPLPMLVLVLVLMLLRPRDRRALALRYDCFSSTTKFNANIYAGCYRYSSRCRPSSSPKCRRRCRSCCKLSCSIDSMNTY